MFKIKYILLLLFTGMVFNIYAQKANEPKKCIDCHGKIISKKSIHKPVTESCDNCHTSNGKKHPLEDVTGFNLKQKVPQLCFTCHQNKYLDPVIHRPVKDGNCLACHGAHSTNENHLVSLPAPKQCYFCHTEMKTTVAKANVVHGVMTDSTSCLNCHTPHSTSVNKLLITDEKSLCLNCHNKPVNSGNRVITNMKQLIETSKYIHMPIDNNGCSICHNPHASNNKDLLAYTFPSGNYSSGAKGNYNACFTTCHVKSMIEDSVSKETRFRNGLTNLHYLHVNKEKSRSCNNCHNVHASNTLYLITDKVKFGDWEMPMRFKKQDKGGSCAPACHQEKIYKR